MHNAQPTVLSFSEKCTMHNFVETQYFASPQLCSYKEPLNSQLSTLNSQFKRVLVAPLNWGLGHATRCVPIIKELLRQGREVVIAADGYPLKFLRQEFPHLEYVEFEGLKVRYANSSSQVGAMLRQLPRFLRDIRREHQELKRIVEAYNIQAVISDNRFGLWCRDAYSIYITHQLMVKMPRGLKWAEGLVWRMHRWFIKHYDECWVPDVDGEDNLSGDLSHKYPLLKNTKYIGVLSRFSSERVEWEDVRIEAEARYLDERYDVVAVLSGPEPHRTNLEREITDNRLQSRDAIYCVSTNREQNSQLSTLNSQLSTLIVQGLPADDLRLAMRTDEGIHYIPHLPTPLLQWYMQEAKQIICRSGYSSIMDLHTIGRKAHLIPTPGQTEQIYLVELHKWV